MPTLSQFRLSQAAGPAAGLQAVVPGYQAAEPAAQQRLAGGMRRDVSRMGDELAAAEAATHPSRPRARCMAQGTQSQSHDALLTCMHAANRNVKSCG